eukprot:3601269-Amphidinium_carterae.2
MAVRLTPKKSPGHDGWKVSDCKNLPENNEHAPPTLLHHYACGAPKGMASSMANEDCADSQTECARLPTHRAHVFDPPPLVK